MLSVFDRNMRKAAVLHNAMDRVEKSVLNGVGTFSFSLPGDDKKAAHCLPFRFIQNDEGEYYRLLDDGLNESETGLYSFAAEHGIATLVDDIMFGSHILGNTGIYTRDVIEYILSKQTVRHWRLGDCDFAKQFEYGFESENLLNALFSVPNLFVEPYMWAYDMRAYPWTVHLKRLDEDARPAFYIRAGKNLIASRRTRTGAEVCTRLYLLGYGEGDNQLTVSSVNGGLPYVQSAPEVVQKYGLISKVYVDRSFEDAQSLLERGRALLKGLEEPQYARTFQVADLYRITNEPYDNAQAGDVARLTMDDTTAFVTGVVRRHDKAGDMEIELSTTATDIASDIADLADRQRIEQTYSQGATQIYAQSVQANADAGTAAVLSFFLPREMRIVNKVMAKITMEAFRSYSRSTQGGGGSAVTSGGGGETATTSGASGQSTNTSTSGGAAQVSEPQKVVTRSATTDGMFDSATGVTKNYTDSNDAAYTNAAGAGDTGWNLTYGTTDSTNTVYTGSSSPVTGLPSNASTSTGDGSLGPHSHAMPHTHTVNSHNHSMSHAHTFHHIHPLYDHSHYMAPHQHYMRHYHSVVVSVDIPGFTINIPNHTHSVTTPSHTHTVSLPSHTHSVSIPTHSHTIEQGIFRFGSPSGAKILVNGTERFTMGTEREIDITEYLLGSDGKIPRGSWIRLGVLPNDLAYITIDLYVQGFVQSRGGGTY